MEFPYTRPESTSYLTYSEYVRNPVKRWLYKSSWTFRAATGSLTYMETNLTCSLLTDSPSLDSTCEAKWYVAITTVVNKNIFEGFISTFWMFWTYYYYYYLFFLNHCCSTIHIFSTLDTYNTMIKWGNMLTKKLKF